MSPVARPDLRHERALLREGARVLVGMDEVGRGALAGPVSVGAVAVELSTRTCPQGVADSKLLTAAARERLLPALGRWGTARAVGHASPAEIDAIGIIAALRLAGRRALTRLGVPVDLVLLDGSHDWLSAPRQQTLFDEPAPGSPVDGLGGVLTAEVRSAQRGDDEVGTWPRVRTRVKADRSCASVAAASILAKCERDALMVTLGADHPAYGWHENKGYGSAEHVEALRGLGPSELHRRSWRLPLLEADGLLDGEVSQGEVPVAAVPRDAVPVDAMSVDAAPLDVVPLGAVPGHGSGPPWSMMDA